MRTADGVTGEGFCFTIDGARIRAFDEMVNGLAQFAIGRSVFEAGRIWADVWGAINPTGHKGVTVAGFSAIDTAVWDAAARRSASAPPHVGAVTDRVDAYASAGFWLSDSTETLVSEAQRFTEMGFRAVKIRVGHDLPTDLERIRTVQSELGDGIAVYTDANQAFEPKEAIRRGLALADAGVTWFEEPVAAGDFAGTQWSALPFRSTWRPVRPNTPASACSSISMPARSMCSCPIFSGSAATPSSRSRLGRRREECADLIALLHRVLACHRRQRSRSRTIQSIDWFQPLFNEAPELVDGQLVVLDRPGHGFTFDRKAVAHHAVD